MKVPCALTIAGSDSGGGAGIQAEDTPSFNRGITPKHSLAPLNSLNITFGALSPPKRLKMSEGFKHGSGYMNRTNTIVSMGEAVEVDDQTCIEVVNEGIDLASIPVAEDCLGIVTLPQQILIKTIPPKRGGRWAQVRARRFVDLKELSFLCGLIRSDASKGKRCISFCNTSLKLVKSYAQIAKKLDLSRYLRVVITHKPTLHKMDFAYKKFGKVAGLPISGVYVNKRGVKIAYRVEIYNSAASRFLLAVEKKLRQLYSRTPQFSRYAIHYLRGVVAGDGSLYWKEKPGLYLRICEVNNKARQEIADIMRTLGMKPFIVQTKNKPPYISTYVASNNALMLLNEDFFDTSPVNRKSILKAISSKIRFKILWSIHEAFGLKSFTARQAGEARGVDHRSFRRILNNYVKLGWVTVRSVMLNGQITKSYQLTEEGLKIAKAMEHASKKLSRC